MERLEFDDYEELACDVVDKLDEIICEDEFNDVAIIAKYEEARQIVKELLCIGCDLKSVQIHDIEYDGYDDEYIISVTKTDDDGEYDVWCEPMVREKGYITDESKVIYVLDTCSSRAIPYCKGETVYEVTVDGDFRCDGCDNRYGCRQYNAANDEKVDEKPVTTSKESFTVNGEKVDKETFEKELAKFEDRYLDNIRDMLLRYADFMDDFNDLLKLVY